MAYAIYTIEAIVCGTYRRNTADSAYLLLTAETGMLYATARSVREERSRQRFALQDFTRVRVSLVRGKAGWLIGSIEARENYYEMASDRTTRGAVVQVIKLIRRFIQAEGPLDAVFTVTESTLTRIVTDASACPWLVSRFELWLLAHLGYVALSDIPPTATVTLEPQRWQPCDELTEHTIDQLRTTATTASQL